MCYRLKILTSLHKYNTKLHLHNHVSFKYLILIQNYWAKTFFVITVTLIPHTYTHIKFRLNISFPIRIIEWKPFCFFSNSNVDLHTTHIKHYLKVHFHITYPHIKLHLKISFLAQDIEWNIFFFQPEKNLVNKTSPLKANFQWIFVMG